MTLAKRPLTDRAIAALSPAPEGKRHILWDSVVPGFGVRVTDNGARSFVLVTRYPSDRSPSPRAIGTVGALSLAAARAKAQEWLALIVQGTDPRVKAETLAASTLAAVAEQWFKRTSDLRSLDQRRSIFDRLILPRLGSRPIGSIRRSEIVALLDTIEDGSGPVAADRALAYLRRLMSWHATRDDEFRSPIVRGMARTKPKERARSRVLTDEELRALWAATEAQNPFSAFVRFLLLTAVRRNEAAQMHRDEVTGTDWIIPAARSKTKVDVVVPLSGAAQAILTGRPDGWVFTTNGASPISGFSKFKAALDARCGVTGWTLHDLRRTARSLMSRAGISADVAERCLGHVIGGVRGVYDRHAYREEKAQAFEALASLVERIVAPAANVVELRR